MTPADLIVLPDAEAVARRGAEILAEAGRDAVARRGSFTLGASGGRTPRTMFALLADAGLPWESVGIWQVDERVAPDGHEDRNLTGLLAALPSEARDVVRPMPVTDPDLEAASQRYAAALPPALDVIHLGIGDDGHTASLVPGDPALDVADRDVVVTGSYRGRRRMTLTYRAIDRSGLGLWLVTGSDKAAVLRPLLEHDPAIPAGRVRTARRIVLADEVAAAGLDPAG
ncbi:MAG: 6-phosphogluconolactonase [Actinomycetota bacterium]